MHINNTPALPYIISIICITKAMLWSGSDLCEREEGGQESTLTVGGKNISRLPLLPIPSNSTMLRIRAAVPLPYLCLWCIQCSAIIILLRSQITRQVLAPMIHCRPSYYYQLHSKSKVRSLSWIDLGCWVWSRTSCSPDDGQTSIWVSKVRSPNSDRVSSCLWTRSQPATHEALPEHSCH